MDFVPKIIIQEDKNMNKKIIALCVCVMMALSFAACSDDDSDKTEKELKNRTTTSTTANTTEADENNSDVQQLVTENQSGVSIVDGEIDTTYYDIDVGTDWDVSTGSDTAIMLTRKGSSITESGSNISLLYTDQFKGIDIDTCLDTLKKQYEAIESYNIESSQIKKDGEYDSCEVVLTTEVLDQPTKLKQVCVLNNENDGNAVIITFTALADQYDSLVGEVDKMVESVDFDN